MYSISSFNDIFSPDNNSIFSVFHHNIDEFILFVNNLNFTSDAIILTETFYNENNFHDTPVYTMVTIGIELEGGVYLILPLKPLRDDSVLRALSSLRGLRGAPAVPPLCRETQFLGQQMLERWEKMG